MAASAGAIDIAQLTDEQLDAIVAKHNQNQSAKLAGLEQQLAGKFQECQELVSSIRVINPEYKPEWERKNPFALTWDIRDYLKEHEGKGTKADIIAALGAMEEAWPAEKVQKTLDNRCQDGVNDNPLWTYDAASETYALTKKGKKK